MGNTYTSDERAMHGGTRIMQNIFRGVSYFIEYGYSKIKNRNTMISN